MTTAVSATVLSGPSRVRVRVIERVDGVARRNLEVEARVGHNVANCKLHSVQLRVPEKQDFECPAPSLGQFPSPLDDRIPRLG
jgi:hypothetical protein